MTSNKKVIFAPFSSQISNGFWQKFSKIKLDAGLTLKNLEIFGYYGPNEIEGVPPLMQLDHSSFEGNQEYYNQIKVKGEIINKDTFEDFRDCDKNLLMQELTKDFSNLFQSDEGLNKIANNPSLLVKFFILTYADLKRHKFFYWFAFPAFLNFQLELEDCYQEAPNKILDLVYNHEHSNKFLQEGFFFIKENSILTLSEINNCDNIDDLIFVFLDSSNIENHPCWVLRNYAAFLIYKLNLASNAKIKFLSLRKRREGRIFSTLVQYEIKSDLKVVGWEKRDDGKFGPKIVNLADSMDPIKLSEAAGDFNLKLMKWRLFPDFDLEKMHSTKVLLLGSGTLGCNVARSLMGWGIKNIHFVDNSNVSYSNLARQSLFEFQDAVENKPKAKCASENLKKILPGMKTSFSNITIPMPGHPASESLLEEFKNSFKTLESCIQESDAIFLLMDTREARWLPTLLGAYFNKIVINAALGFDSYLVMQHGKNLGCYFCSDVVAPGDSTKDRTLDQQCTVTRPGISMIAAGFAVELLAAILHESSPSQSLGKIPHTIRGFLSSGEIIMPTFAPFDKCSGCSDKVLQKYKEEGLEFILKVSKDPSILEQITGLDELKCGADEEGIIVLSDFEDD